MAQKNLFKAYKQIEPKAMSRLRADIKIWKQAEIAAFNVEDPKRFLLQNLFSDAMRDALMTSQINNRKLKTLGSQFSFADKNEKINQSISKNLNKAKWFADIMNIILDSSYFGYSLLEIDLDKNKLPTVQLIPRTNVIPERGIILKDYYDIEYMDYKNAREYGTWLLDFGKAQELGLINKAIPHVLFKRFAYSCWSELCEIYGIPPRVMKTNTADPRALQQAEQMMREWGSAAWAIIDDTETIEFAQASASNGEVYEGLMRFANNEMSMLISGAVVGQDTQNGSNSKEQSSQELLHSLINADKTRVEQYMNSSVIPALANIGILPNNLTFQFDQVEDIAELWNRTKEILPFKNVDDQWIKNKFGIEVTGDRMLQQQAFSMEEPDFFV